MTSVRTYKPKLEGKDIEYSMQTVKFVDGSVWVVLAKTAEEGRFFVVYTANLGVHVFTKKMINFGKEF